MRKFKLMVGAAALVAGISLQGIAPAMAAELANGSSQTCSGLALWHFVNNQTGGQQTPGTITAIFTKAGQTSYVVSSGKVNQNMQHFYVTTEVGATLVSASTNLAGRLVLSDFSCVTGKDPK
jgi:hypothetical protein